MSGLACPACHQVSEEDPCTHCGAAVLSDPDAKIEALVERASIPNLASLFKGAKEKGLIQPTTVYGG